MNGITDQLARGLVPPVTEINDSTKPAPCMGQTPIKPGCYDKGTISATLAERGDRYGTFVGHAEVTQRLKEVIASGLEQRGKILAPDQQEALDMICHKIGRIVNGDPNYADSWHDIAGYASLVDKRLTGTVL